MRPPSIHRFYPFYRAVAAFSVYWFVFQGGNASAQSVPSLINNQGRLSDSNGVALPTTDYQLSFSIWDTNSGGNLVWGPQIFDGVQGTNGHGLKVPVVQGYFNVILGPSYPGHQTHFHFDQAPYRLVDVFGDDPS